MTIYIGTGSTYAAPSGDLHGGCSGTITPPPKVGQTWPRGSKTSAS